MIAPSFGGDGSGAIQQFGRWADLFVRLGLPTDRLYARLDIGDAIARWPSLPYRDFLRVLATAEEEYGPSLAEDIAAAKTVADFGVVGYLFMNAPTLRTSLEAACYWLPAINSQAKVKIESTDQQVTIQYLVPGVPPIAQALAVEIALLELVRGIRSYTGRKDWLPEAVSFEHAPRANARSIASSLGECVSFDQPMSGIRLPRELMRAQNPNADTALFEILENQKPPPVAPPALAREDIVAAVQRLVSEGVQSGRLAADDIALELALSKRTLYRRLKEAGTSLGRVREATLIPIAKDLLSRGLDISTIAYRLGYSESRSFARAFKRATGTSPAEYRQYLKAVAPVPIPASPIQQSAADNEKPACAPGKCFFESASGAPLRQGAHHAAGTGRHGAMGQNASPTNR